ncbi:inorganic phosphate transporter [Desulfovirgula thermocuniculi]|uniref:inorganic phosphate transporter n=1 Tax=Desulfovirgula thermocuniculi TaxID=348842 RepID=UPI000487D293|nr:inorganic phosphate transporter [Desulfovirgula thermocuniculi]
MEWLLLPAILFLALVFDFINGFHDTANAVATSLATGALTPRRAIMLAAAMNFLGALFFSGVALAVAEGVCDPAAQHPGAVAAALLAAITWNLLTWFWGLPSSSSHALVGALAGAALASSGPAAVNAEGLARILRSLALSPLLAAGTGFAVMKALGRPGPSLYPAFKSWQRLAAALQAFSHGTNDAQKTAGVITLALFQAGYLEALAVPLWVKLLAALAMGLGTSCGGWRIIRTVGKGITRLDPPTGFASDLSAGLVILGATLWGLPVSSTHVVSSAVTGAGLARGRGRVNRDTVARMALAWALTLPACAALGALWFLAVNAYHRG